MTDPDTERTTLKLTPEHEQLVAEIMESSFLTDQPLLTELFGPQVGAAVAVEVGDGGAAIHFKPLADFESGVAYSKFQNTGITEDEHRYVLDQERAGIEPAVRLAVLSPEIMRALHDFKVPLPFTPEQFVAELAEDFDSSALVGRDLPEANDDEEASKRRMEIENKMTYFESEAISNEASEAYQRAITLAIAAGERLLGRVSAGA